jgi:hypothetical protein
MPNSKSVVKALPSQMTVLPNGNVGIGITNPQVAFHSVGGVYQSINAVVDFKRYAASGGSSAALSVILTFTNSIFTAKVTILTSHSENSNNTSSLETRLVGGNLYGSGPGTMISGGTTVMGGGVATISSTITLSANTATFTAPSRPGSYACYVLVDVIGIAKLVSINIQGVINTFTY